MKASFLSIAPWYFLVCTIVGIVVGAPGIFIVYGIVATAVFFWLRGF